MSDPLNIRKLIAEIQSGRLRVPNFQRGFVWDPSRVAYLMDSIYKGYPFGAILLWRTQQTLTHERNLGPFSLPPNQPSFPTDYILDGQQRVTSMFGVFQTDILLDQKPLWANIYYDFETVENAQESSFVALEGTEVDRKRHFPIGCFFDSVTYRKETSSSKVDNNLLSGSAPSIYRTKMPADVSVIMRSNALPESTFDDVYSTFVDERAKILARLATDLCN